MIYKLGIILFIAGTILLFSSNVLYKKGKITTVKELLSVKSTGLGLVILATILMLLGK